MICSNFPPGMESVNLDSEFTAVDTTMGTFGNNSNNTHSIIIFTNGHEYDYIASARMRTYL